MSPSGAGVEGQRRDLITFTSDFGLDDIFVGVCHAVLAGAARHARVVDLTHAVARGDVRHGAVLLARAVPHTPMAVHLAVVDPGVGGDRRGIAVATARGDVLVGPDNGLLLPAADELGGSVGAHELADPGLVRRADSATFHGRDLFAPAAAAVAAGVPVGELGPPVDEPVSLSPPHLAVEPGAVTAEVVLVDRFGNVQLAAPGGALDDIGLEPGAPAVVRVVATVDGRRPTPGSDAGRRASRVRAFVDLDPDQLGVHVDSDGMVAVVVRDGAAAEELGIGRGALVRVERPDDRGDEGSV